MWISEGRWTRTHIVFGFTVPEKVFSSRNKNVKGEIEENDLDVTLFSLGSKMTLNCRDEKPRMLFISLKILLPLVDSCDSQHHFIRKQYLQTWWNDAAAWPFFFSHATPKSVRASSVVKVNCSSYDYQLLRKKSALIIEAKVKCMYLQLTGTGLKISAVLNQGSTWKTAPHAQRYVHIHMHAHNPTLLIFQAKATVLVRSIKCFCW